MLLLLAGYFRCEAATQPRFDGIEHTHIQNIQQYNINSILIFYPFYMRLSSNHSFIHRQAILQKRKNDESSAWNSQNGPFCLHWAQIVLFRVFYLFLPLFIYMCFCQLMCVCLLLCVPYSHYQYYFILIIVAGCWWLFVEPAHGYYIVILVRLRVACSKNTHRKRTKPLKWRNTRSNKC